ncbi:hypothetical protein K461DRAFT_312775 [Myriangium duriaei CBS 260.36]|uniref:Uncharacterized protein n=1 Tax=Myriangium duriaei CBS 260.36 TaxID=1168546 RepID=A0A9P4MKQ2_9PEZI|nr:hypothetical protein K461DRAFT_312775 [Myriangium duriaei CBS 260.36]
MDSSPTTTSGIRFADLPLELRRRVYDFWIEGDPDLRYWKIDRAKRVALGKLGYCSTMSFDRSDSFTVWHMRTPSLILSRAWIREELRGQSVDLSPKGFSLIVGRFDYDAFRIEQFLLKNYPYTQLTALCFASSHGVELCMNNQVRHWFTIKYFANILPDSTEILQMQCTVVRRAIDAVVRSQDPKTGRTRLFLEPGVVTQLRGVLSSNHSDVVGPAFYC